MPDESILESINSWATERGLNYTAESLPSPPPFLDSRPPIQNPSSKIQNSPDASGNCLFSIVVLLALSIVVVLAFGLPLWNKASETYQSMFEWTPESINADPQGYLRWALAELNSLEQRCRSEQIRLRAGSMETERKLAVTRETAAQQEAALKSRVETYRAAAGNWPIAADGKSWSEPELSGEILRLDTLLRSNQALVPALESALGTFPELLSAIEARAAEIARLKVEVHSARSLLSINELTSTYKAIQSQARQIGDYARVLQSMSKPADPSERQVEASLDAADRSKRLQKALNR